MTDSPLLQTKLFIPRLRSDRVRRARLIKALDCGVDTRLTLVSAPAGFGKTTLLSEWAAASGMPTAWISLDKGDNHVETFFRYVVAAVRGAVPETAAAADALTTVLSHMLSAPISNHQISNQTAGHLIDLFTRFDQDCALVLDDYHIIESPEVHRIVSSFVDHLPHHIHFKIATRSDPPLPLSRLRVRGQLKELRAADLSFNQSETAVFFQQAMHLELNTGDIDIIKARTEGWVAGLQLAALSMRSHVDITAFVRSFAGDDRLVVDYLAEEVLNHLPEHIRDFLLHTAILNRLSASLCDAVAGTTGSQEILEDLDRKNLFIIALDNRRQWFRYHHLFADLLRSQLQHRMKTLLPTLHCRASSWYEANGLKEEAVEHALAGEDFELASRLLGAFAARAWEFGGNTRMLQWYKALPDDFIHTDTELCFFSAWMLFENGQYQAAEEHLQIAERLTAQKAPNHVMADGVKNELLGKVAVIRAYMASFRRDLPEILKHSTLALARLPESSPAWRATASITQGDALYFAGRMDDAVGKYEAAAEIALKIDRFFVYIAAIMGLTKVKRHQGDLSGAMALFEDVLNRARTAGLSQMPMIGWVHLRFGDLLSERRQLEDAGRHIQIGSDRGRDGDDASMIGQAHLCSARLSFIKGEFAAAWQAVAAIEAIAADADLPRFVTEPLDELRVRLWLRQGKLKTAVQWAVDHPLPEAGFDAFSLESLYVQHARILLATGDADKARALLEPPLVQAEKEGRMFIVVEMLLIKAMALDSLKVRSEAAAILTRALILANSMGCIAVFLHHGQPLTRMLEKVLDSPADLPREYAGRILAAMKVAKVVATEDGLLERLSDREQEVLRYLAAGLSNKKITETMFISISTVKTHIRNIYGKLNVNNRTGAVARARELDLL